MFINNVSHENMSCTFLYCIRVMGEYLIRGHLTFKTVVILTFCIYDNIVLDRKKDLCGTSVEAVQDIVRQKS